jgi:hypothetical protein
MTDSDGEPLFGQKHDSFESAFPDIKAIDIRVEETDLVKTQKTRQYTIESAPGREPCTNSQCTNEGIRLDQLVSQMTHNGETHAEFSEGCKGAEKMGRNDSRTCPHRFDVEIDITYK